MMGPPRRCGGSASRGADEPLATLEPLFKWAPVVSADPTNTVQPTYKKVKLPG